MVLPCREPGMSGTLRSFLSEVAKPSLKPCRAAEVVRPGAESKPREEKVFFHPEGEKTAVEIRKGFLLYCKQAHLQDTTYKSLTKKQNTKPLFMFGGPLGDRRRGPPQACPPPGPRGEE